ncbi:MAG TPA: rod shape-determining protein MreD [Sediminispirochaeta sp.]|nr:rod shape-determining protein MreD [Sediminispirochaeta sp.]
MSRRTPSWVFIALLLLISLLQTGILPPPLLRQLRVDLVLLFLVFFAHQDGTMTGMLAGFSSGLLLDFLSFSPLGYHSFLYTSIGYLFGLTRGKVYLDGLAMPLIFALAASLIKLTLSFFLLLIFIPDRIQGLASEEVLIQIGMQIFLSPFIFALLWLLKLSKEQVNQL